MTAEAADAALATADASFAAAVEAYLVYLRVERGLSPRTRSACASDLRAFAAGPPGLAG